MPTTPNTEYYLDIADKLGELKVLRSKFKFLVQQDSLRLQSRLESLRSIESDITEMELTMRQMQRDREIKSPLMQRIEELGKRFGL